MKPISHLLAVFLASASLPALQASEFPAGSPRFNTTYDAAMKAAAESGKPVIMIFSASWCPPCQANKNNVYPAAQVKPYHDKFVWAYLDADNPANRPAMQKFGVSGIPHVQFLTKEGASLGHFAGGTTPGLFVDVLDQVLAHAAGSKGSGRKI